MTPPPIECFFIVSTAIILVSVLFIKEINAMEKQLRSMSATVQTRMLCGRAIMFLRSYDTIVMAYYPIANALYISPYYDCSQTTMKHVRAFLQDYADVTVSIPDLRKRIDGMTFDLENRSIMLDGMSFDLDYRSIMLDGEPFNVFTCSQQQMLYMFHRSQER